MVPYTLPVRGIHRTIPDTHAARCCPIPPCRVAYPDFEPYVRVEIRCRFKCEGAQAAEMDRTVCRRGILFLSLSLCTVCTKYRADISTGVFDCSYRSNLTLQVKHRQFPSPPPLIPLEGQVARHGMYKVWFRFIQTTDYGGAYGGTPYSVQLVQ